MPRYEDDDDDRPRRPWDARGRGDDRGRDDDRPRRPRGDDDRPRRPRDEDEDDRPRRRHSLDDDDYEDDRPRRRPQQGGNGLAVAGIILGVLGFCTAGLTAIPGLICSAIALGKPAGRGAAIAGLALSVLGGLGGVGLLFFGVSRVRDAGVRMTDQNNLKQLGLAFHSQGDMNAGMAGPYAVDSRGTVNRELSFRAGLLPFIEQDTVYRQLDVTQAWNSPRNKSATGAIIKTFNAPGDEPSTNTPYRVFYGGGAVFEEDGKPVSLVRITDGTSNTILMVHATEQVPWAEPREFRYSDTAPLPKLGAPGAKGANVVFADGSVRFISNSVPERTLRLMITKADGQRIPDDQ